jgi:hypothetical protein
MVHAFVLARGVLPHRTTYKNQKERITMGTLNLPTKPEPIFVLTRDDDGFHLTPIGGGNGWPWGGPFRIPSDIVASQKLLLEAASLAVGQLRADILTFTAKSLHTAAAEAEASLRTEK